MALFTPARRWGPAYRKFGRQSVGQKMLPLVERTVKGPLFGCRMCGNCLLQETAFICPMECPKGLRNGPCGGSTEVCYVDPTRRCVWYAIYQRAEKLGREEMLMEVLPPVDWAEVGDETWGDVARQAGEVGLGKVAGGLAHKETRHDIWQAVFEPVRQPEWWDGDAEYHPPAYTEPVSELERRLRAGEFVATNEVTAPLGTRMGPFHDKLDFLKEHVVAANFTDGAAASARMSSLAAAQISLERGLEPVLQIASRDVTRVGLQAQAVGAAATGIRNLFVVTGDSAILGVRPKARLDWHDLDAVQMLWVLRRLRDEGIFLGGKNVPEPPQYFLGAAASPFSATPRIQALREHKKVNAGAQFFQTQVIFDVDLFARWLEELDRRQVLDKVYVLAGITPVRSFKGALYMHEKVPGIVIPDAVLDRYAKAGDDIRQVGYEIALETLNAVKDKHGVHGVHFMPLGWNEVVPRLLTDAGVQDAAVPPADAPTAATPEAGATPYPTP